VGKQGIWVKAKIYKDLTPRISECWQLIKAGLVGGFSIGFSVSEYEEIPGSYGLKFNKWSWLELSAVTIPANAEATIQTIKSASPSTPGQRAAHLKTTPPAGGKSTPLLGKPKMKTLAEQIKSFEDTKAANVEKLNGIMQKAADEGRTLDAAESEEFDTLQSDVAAVEKHVERLKATEAVQVSKAAPVDGSSSAAGSASRSGQVISVKSNEPAGLGFAKVLKCIYEAQGNRRDAVDVAKAWYGDGRVAKALQEKAAAPSATVANPAYGGYLTEYQLLRDEFIDFVRKESIIGKFMAGTNGVQPFRNAPFNTLVNGQSAGTSAGWVGEGGMKPVTSAELFQVRLEEYKITGMVAISKELIKRSDPAADVWLRDDLVKAIAERENLDFIDPAITLTAGVRPASVTNGANSITASGTTSAALRADILALKSYLRASNQPTSGGALIMHPDLAGSIGDMRTAVGFPEFDTLDETGGKLGSYPVVTTDAMAGNAIVWVRPQDIFYATGPIEVSYSEHASIDKGDGVQVSMFQTNQVAVLVERFLNYKKARANATVVISGAAYAPA